MSDALATTDAAVVHVVDGATLTRTGLTITGDMPYDRWEFLGQKLRAFEGSVMWWLGDWLNYGEAAYGEKYSQALDTTEYSYETLRQAARVAKALPVCSRLHTLSWSHHQEVAGLEPSTQDAILDKAVQHGMTRKELREFVRLYKRKLTQPAELPAGTYSLIYADPPWRYDFAQDSADAIENQYPTMAVEEICALPVAGISAPDCVLFLWATNPKLREALEVMAAWGFAYKTNMVWVKNGIGLGYYARAKHELLLIGTKGEPAVPAPEDRPASVIEADKGRHSQKPACVAELLEGMYPKAQRVELFCRDPREGWAVWGNEVQG